MSILQQLSELDSAEISDALDSLGIEGVLLGIKPLVLGKKIIGPVFTVKYLPFKQKPDEFKNAGNYIDTVPSGSVILIDNNGSQECTNWGDILTRVALQRGIKGTVIHGSCRDVDLIRELDYSIFSSGITMRSGKNRVYKSDEQCELKIGLVTIKPGDTLFADDSGALIIPQQHLDEVIKRAKIIKSTEEKIIQAISEGSSLKQSRAKYHYDKPWLAKEASA